MAKAKAEECKIEEVLLNSAQRKKRVEELLKLDGLKYIKENSKGIYCAVPLTGVPPQMRHFISKEHEKIKAAIAEAGLEIYDPKYSEFNPWEKLIGTPLDIYDQDTLQVVSSRFLGLTNLTSPVATNSLL